jgi:SP family facilitated glucose transporter-like MFS transporter 3
VASLTCKPSLDDTSFLPACLGITDGIYSLVTAVFTVGGLIGSLSSSWLVEKQGLKGGLVWVGWLNMLGVGMMALAPSWIVLALGR